MTENIIAVVGAGFGGLKAALDISAGLRQKQLQGRYQVILINRTLTHIYTPLLYKYASHPELDIWSLTIPVKQLIEGSDIDLLQEEVLNLDPEKGMLRFRSGKELKAGYILLAPGSETGWFGIPGLKENSLSLKTLDDAKLIKDKLSELPDGSKILVAGGGPTGVEMAAELSLNRNLSVSLIEAAPTILPGFPGTIIQKAEKRLRSLNVEILADHPIAEVGKNLVTDKNGQKIPFGAMIWAGGTQIPEWVKDLPLKKEARGRIETSPTMECSAENPTLKISPMLYAIGDSACIHFPDGKPMPPMARPAIEEAKIAAKNILIDILTAEGLSSASKHLSYQPVHYPYVVPIGGRYALAEIGPIRLAGLPAWIFKEIVSLYYLLSILRPNKALKTWWRGF